MHSLPYAALQCCLLCVHVWSQDLDIGQIYKALGSKEYHLHSMVCYYGEHYHAFVHTEGRWVAFDDATLSDVGPWEAVVKKCILGKIQPSLLFYEERLGG